MDEDKESDKKLFLLIQGDIYSMENLEEKIIDFFMKYGKIRERPRIEATTSKKNKMIITFANHKDASNAIEAFPQSAVYKEAAEKGLALKLDFYRTKENKIYCTGLKEVDEKAVEEAFSIFGEVSEVKLMKLKNGSTAATVEFTME